MASAWGSSFWISWAKSWGDAARPVATLTRLGSAGYGVKRTGSFAGKTPHGSVAHPVARITRMGSAGYGVRRVGSFTGKTPGIPSIGADKGGMMLLGVSNG